jgi:membrane-associated phospholipid phosphatase
VETILDQGIIITMWIQSLGDWLLPVAQFFSFMGSEPFFLLLAPAIYWCIDPILGIRAGLYLILSSGLNAILKILFHLPRPYWVSLDVKALAAESSFGLPSGHSQTSVVVWGTIAHYLKRRWAWGIAFVLIFFIGISRIYLAVHFPSDVLLGWIIGIILLWLLIRWEKPFLTWFKTFNIYVQILFILLVSMGLIIFFSIISVSVGESAVFQTWIDTSASAAPEAGPIHPLSNSSIVSNAGAFLGMAIGAIWIGKRGFFNPRGTVWQLSLRYLIGLIGVLILWSGLGTLLPDGEELIPLILRYIRYALVGLWIIGVAPMLFAKLKLIQPTN